MLTEKQIDQTMAELHDGIRSLDIWDALWLVGAQAKQAIDLAAENERLKDERKRLIENNTILSDALDRAKAKLGEIRDMCFLASGKGESYETSWFSGYSACADEIMAILDKDGDET